MNDDTQQGKIYPSEATNNSERKLNCCSFSQAFDVVASQSSFSYYTVTSALIKTTFTTRCISSITLLMLSTALQFLNLNYIDKHKYTFLD
jgi:hypothetical protein